MIDKRMESAAAAVADISDGATVLISGFGEAGNPTELVHALIDHGARELTVVNNNAGNGRQGLAALIGSGLVKRVVCSYPRSSHSYVFDEMYRSGKVELEIVPQGTMAERIRAAGAGIGGFYTRTTVGTPLAEDKEVRTIGGADHVLEHPLHADVALVKADRADRWGNLVYRMAARSFGPIMCTAATTTIVQVREIVELGELDPEHVVTPGVYVDRVVEVPNPLSEREALEQEDRA